MDSRRSDSVQCGEPSLVGAYGANRRRKRAVPLKAEMAHAVLPSPGDGPQTTAGRIFCEASYDQAQEDSRGDRLR